MYTAIELAKYIVSKCVADNCPISNLQLQKILYYIQKDYLTRDMLAFSDDIEAWQFGPAVPDVYYHYCGFGAMPISDAKESFDVKPEDARYIDAIVEAKRKLRPWALVAETHKPGGAWDQVYQNGKGNHCLIPTSLIKEVG